MRWELKKFADLTNKELYDVLRLRVDIFVVEQTCPYPEIDGKDPESLHLMYWKNGNIVAYARILPPSLSFDEASIGRIIVAKSHRGTGLGHELLDQAIKASLAEYNQPIKIGAQAYLEKYYEAAGFVTVSDVYLEDDIPHIDMLRSL